jgi:formate dehydrogenase subunit delta
MEKLVRMANQIGDFYASMPEPEAAKAVATHLRMYWTPRMISEIVAFAARGQTGLSATAAHGIEALNRIAPAA